MWDKILKGVKDKILGTTPSVLGNLINGRPANFNLPQYGGVVSPLPVNQTLPKASKSLPLPKEIKTVPTRVPSPTPTIGTKIISPLADKIKTTPIPKLRVPKAYASETTPYEHNIDIPGSQGGRTRVPSSTAQVLMEAFDPINEATNAAQVLHHPRSQTYTPKEIKRFGRESWNHGENASFKDVADSTQTDGSVDRGLMRINSNTFNGLLARHPDWMQKIGVNNFEQMKDPALNAQVARLVLLDSNYDNGQIRKNPSWARWFAAPLPLRTR